MAKTNTRKSNGSGSFKKRADGTYEYRASYGYGMDGKLIRKSFYGKTQSECRDKQKEYDRRNSVPIEKVYTVAEWALKWLELYKKDKCSPKTYEQYESIVVRYINRNIGKLKLFSVKPAHIAEMMNKYKDMSESLVKKTVFLIKSIFETAVDNDFCVKNPAKNVKPIGVKPKEKEFFSDKEIKIIKEFCLKERSNISDALIVLLYTGLRREELLGLKWEDIDFENKTIKIDRAVIIENNRRKVRDDLKTESSRRIIPMLPETENILRTKPRISEYIFPCRNHIHGENSEQLPTSFNKTYMTLIKRINSNNDYNDKIRELSPHCCRHTFATHLSKSGVDIKIIQSVLGHSDIKMTGNIYTHSTIDGMKKALEGFNY